MSETITCADCDKRNECVNLGGCGVADCDISRRLSAKLKRAEGQIRGICKMIEEGRECSSVIMQISAVEAALSGVAKDVLYHHIEHCVMNGIEQGRAKEALSDLEQSVNQFLKMK